MKTNIFKLIYLLILSFLLTNSYLFSESAEERDPYEILFIGSSYFNYNNLPGLFDSLATAADHDVFIDRSITNGLYLADHVDRPITVEKIYQQDWDYVILQGCGSLMAYPEYYTDHPVYPALIALRDMILDNCPTTKIIFCMPWAFEDGMTWVPDWTDTFLDMQQYIYDNTLLYSAEIGFEISPVGWAWRTVLIEQDFPLHYLHMNDWNHPSLRGSYLMACVIFTHVYLQTSAGLDFDIELPEEEINYFQMIGSDTVLDDLELWNIITTYAEQEEIPGSREIILYNYPNPFNPSTTIRCQGSGVWSQGSGVRVLEDIELTIYNIKGQKVKTYAILSGNSGTSEINSLSASQLLSISFTWNGTDDYNQPVPSGIYFYKLKTGNREITRKMLLLK